MFDPPPTPAPSAPSAEDRAAVSEALQRWFDACWEDPDRRPVMEATLSAAPAARPERRPA